MVENIIELHKRLYDLEQELEQKNALLEGEGWDEVKRLKEQLAETQNALEAINVMSPDAEEIGELRAFVSSVAALSSWPNDTEYRMIDIIKKAQSLLTEE